jgi:methylenetetrahydrofolate reductase (NADPH)
MFPGKEIATATMVEAVSFRTWAEEAFSLWAEWGRVVGEAGGIIDETEFRGGAKPGAAKIEEAHESKMFLRHCAENCMLVNVIGHEFRDGDLLWDILMKAAGEEIE